MNRALRRLASHIRKRLVQQHWMRRLALRHSRGLLFQHRAAAPVLRCPFTPLSSAPKKFLSVGQSASEESASEPSKTTGSEEGGVQEGVLWFDSIFPIVTWRFDPRKYMGKRSHEKLIPKLLPEQVRIKQMLPRHREGGVFVYFECGPGITPEEVAEAVTNRLIDHPVHAPLALSPRHVKVHLVRGQPFLEDLKARFPSTRLRVELEGPLVAPEVLYALFRDFGRIYDYKLTPPGKDQPGVYTVQFVRIDGAVGARNCLHRLRIEPPGTTLHITYEGVLKTSVLVDLFNKHTRLFVALFGILFAIATYLIFDPIRMFFVKNKITGGYGSLNMGTFRWLRDQALGLFKKEGEAVRPLWEARLADQDAFRKWLSKPPDRLLFIVGSRGSGKLDLVQSVTEGRANVLHVDVTPFIDKETDEFVQGLCSAVGFFPAFKFQQTINSLMDVITPGASKAASSASTGQVMKVLETITLALESLRRGAEDNDASSRDSAAADEQLPLFIIEGFSDENKSKHNNFLQTFCKWANLVTERKLARFVFLTEGPGVEDSMQKAIPDLKTDSITLSDASLEAALEFVQSVLKEPLQPEAVQAISVLGGRYSDLVQLVRGIQSGMKPKEAAEEIISNAMSLVRTHLMAPPTPEEEKNKVPRWTKVQMWQVLRMLADSPDGETSYDHVLFNVFKGDEEAFRSLMRVDLIRPVHRVGRPSRVRAGSPVLWEAFKRLASDPKLRPGMDLLVLKALTDQEMAKLTVYEEELFRLQATISGATALPSGRGSEPAAALPPEVLQALIPRRDFLAQSIKELHEKIAKYDTERRRCEAQVKAAPVL